MRLVILSLFYLYLVTGQDTLKDVLGMLRKEKLLHKIPSSDLSGLFTPPPEEKEVLMDFNMDSSETLIRHRRQAEPNETSHFEREDYDFMAPEGKTEKAAPLAVLTFLTPAEADEPSFTITEDSQQWFEIGKIKKSQANDTIKFRIAVNQKAGAEVKFSETKKGIYWITVEAKQSSGTVATVVRVDVLSLGPAVPKRIKSTTAPTSTTEEVTTTSTAIPISTTEEVKVTTAAVSEPAEVTEKTVPVDMSTSESTTIQAGTSLASDVEESATETIDAESTTTSSSTAEPVVQSTTADTDPLNTWVQENNATQLDTAELGSTDKPEDTSSENPDLLVTREEIFTVSKELSSTSIEVSTTEATVETTGAEFSQEPETTPESTTEPVESTDSSSEVTKEAEITTPEPLETTESRTELNASTELKLTSPEKPETTKNIESTTSVSTTLTTKPIPVVEDVIGTTTKGPSSLLSSTSTTPKSETPVMAPIIDVEIPVSEKEEPEPADSGVGSPESVSKTVDDNSIQLENPLTTDIPHILTSAEVEDISTTISPAVTSTESSDNTDVEETESTTRPIEASSMLIGEFLVEKSTETVEGSGEVTVDEEKATPATEEPTTSAEILTSVKTSTSETSTEIDEDPLTDAVTVSSIATTVVMASEETSTEKDFSKPTTHMPTSSEIDDPLTGAVTIATEIVQPELRLPLEQQDEESSDLTLDIAGSPNDMFLVPSELSAGDMIRGLTIVPNWNHKIFDFIHLTVAPTDVVEIRPKYVESGGKAYFILKNGPISTEVKIKVIAEFGDARTTKTVTLRSANADSASPAKGNMETVVLKIQENSPSGTTIGKLEGGNDYKVIGDSGKFALLSDSVILSCPDDVTSCIDREDQKIHQMMLIPKDVTGVSSPKQIIIEVEDVNDNPSHLEATDDVIRIADSKLIIPFAAQILDADDSDEHKLMLEGSAADFIQMENVGKGLYQAVTKGAVAAGRYELLLTASDGKHTDTKRIRVHAQNSKSKAHFRRPRYERIISAEKVVQGDEFLRVELEGVPIDEAKFLILSGNPGWLAIDDYDGTLRFKKSNRAVQSGSINTRIGAVDRASGRLLAETVLITKVEGGPEKKNRVFPKKFYEKTFDRESESDFSVSLDIPADAALQLREPSFFALDENGQTKDFDVSHISTAGDKVTVPKNAVSNLRILRFDLESDGDRATIVFHFSSSDEYVMHRHRMATKPVFPQPWSAEKQNIELSIDEELPIGHVVAVIPAFNPQDGNSIDVRLEDPTGSFKIDEKTGAISITRLLDHESMPEDIQLKLKSGEEGYESMANVKVQIRDIDDNPPVFNRDGLVGELVIPENLPGESVIAKLHFTDADYISHANGFKSAVFGSGENLFTTNVLNDTIVLSVRPNAVLDREVASQYTLAISVIDSAGHTDTVPISISLSDENDNSPVFDREMYNVQAVENWPAGVILHKLRAIDTDQGERGRVNYHLMPTNAKYFSIDSVTGDFSISRDLIGLAREEPYLLTAVATDGGMPPRNATASIRVKVSEALARDSDSRMVFESPDIDYVLKLKEDIQINEKVYQVKAKSASQAESHMHIRYSAKELNSDEEHFGIDESTGEIVLNKELDYETKKDHVIHLLNLAATIDVIEPEPTNVRMEKLERRLQSLLRRVGRRPEPESVPSEVKEKPKRRFFKRKKASIRKTRSASPPPIANHDNFDDEIEIGTRNPEPLNNQESPPEPQIIREAVATLNQIAAVKLLQLNAERPRSSSNITELSRSNREDHQYTATPAYAVPPVAFSEVPFIDTELAGLSDAAVSTDIPSEYGTDYSHMSSLPHLAMSSTVSTRRTDVSSRESGYTSSLSLSPREYTSSCDLLSTTDEILPTRPLRGMKKMRYRQSSTEGLNLQKHGTMTRALTMDQLNRKDPVDSFMKDNVYKTKYVTCVLEARNGGLEDVLDEALQELQAWFSKGKMLAAACEVHFSVPITKRNRRAEQKLKSSLLACVRDNNNRILSLARSGRRAPIELVEARTEDHISTNKDVETIEGVYHRSYSRLLRYSHDDTSEWHRPYWRLPQAAGTGNLRPAPGHFLFGESHYELKSTTVIAVNVVGLCIIGSTRKSQIALSNSLVDMGFTNRDELLLTASHLFEPSNTTRILRILVENVDDNEPKFPKSAPSIFTLRSDAPIGRLMASDADGDPFFYYLLPSCSPLTRFFTIEKEFGEISFAANDELPDSHLTLCAMVSADHSLDVSKLQYSEGRSDMTKFIVVKEQTTSHRMTEDVINTNGSVTLMDPNLERVSVQVEETASANLSLQIDKVDYTPSETVPPLTKPNSPESLFSLDNNGNVRVSPQMSNQPEGVYKVAMNTNVDKETLMKEFHLIEDAHKMQFIFNEPVEKLSQNLNTLKSDLSSALKTDRPEADFSINFALPRQDKNISRSSICFHIVRDGMILSPHTTMTTISQTAAADATKLAQAYQKHAVVNIEPCLALLPSSHHPSADSAPYDEVIPLSTLILICAVAFFAFLLFVLIVYLCFVRRYKTYLQKKERNLKLRNNSPPPMAPSPTFMLAPSQLTPPLGYWEA